MSCGCLCTSAGCSSGLRNRFNPQKGISVRPEIPILKQGKGELWIAEEDNRSHCAVRDCIAEDEFS